ncbi:alanine racemase [Devriesea agamarum]|uniref:alanine racemase n=1 Tax=Devriesea agamarum TaxID=472569 RepID=UPI00071C9B97|nr:alanine racemase [Devriesea agamarum]
MNARVPARVSIDTQALTDNARALHRVLAPGAQLMAVVKADGYGHGLVTAARAALAGGASWLGVAHPDSALALRDAGITAPILAWLPSPGTADLLCEVIARNVEVGAGSVDMLDVIATAARAAGRMARVHLELDTGFGRGGVIESGVTELVGHAADLAASGALEVVGAWTHLAVADEPDRPETDDQLRCFDRGCTLIERVLKERDLPALRWRHAANSAAILTRPDAHYNLVRAGIALYGYPPVSASMPDDVLDESIEDAEVRIRRRTEAGPQPQPPSPPQPRLQPKSRPEPDSQSQPQPFLRPAMTLSGELALVKRVNAGQGVSYGLTHMCDRDTVLGIVPVGYADGLHRAASGGVRVLVETAAGAICVPQIGRICMDQIVLDLGPDAAARVGDKVVLFGDGPVTADNWAQAAGTIAYEVLTSVSSRIPRETQED